MEFTSNTCGGICQLDSIRSQLVLTLCNARIIHETQTCFTVAIDFQNEANSRAEVCHNVFCKKKQIPYCEASHDTRNPREEFFVHSKRFRWHKAFKDGREDTNTKQRVHQTLEIQTMWLKSKLFWSLIDG